MIIEIAAVVRPRSLREVWAVEKRIRGERRFIAGGTDLLVKAKEGKVARATLIDISAVGELRGVRETATEVVIGAATPFTDIIASGAVRRWCPALVEAARSVGSPQIRNRGTLGGNVANASPAADGVVALVAHGARAVVKRAGKRREVAVAEIAAAPGVATLDRGDLIAEIRIPKRKGSGAFEKLGSRASLAIAKVSLALVAEVRRGRLVEPRVALGAVAPTVIHAPETERILGGGPIDASRMADAERAIQREARPITDFRSTADYRRAMCAVLLRRAVRRITEK